MFQHGKAFFIAAKIWQEAMNPKHAYEIQNGKQAENNANKKRYKHKTTVTGNDVKKEKETFRCR